MNKYSTALLAIAAISSSCGTARKTQSNVNFTAFTDKTKLDASLLYKMKTTGKLDLCVYASEHESEQGAAESKKIRQSVHSMVDKAIQQWNGLLKDNPNWPHKGSIPVNLLNKESEKTPCKGDMTIFNFLTEQGTKAGTGLQGTLFAMVKDSVIVITDATLKSVMQNNKLATLEEAKRGVITHEMGHLLGLGDSYEVHGYLENAGNQPNATMNGRSQFLFPNNMSGDDSAGLNTLVDHFFGGKPLLCPESYVTNTRATGSWSSELLVCEVKTGATPGTGPITPTLPIGTGKKDKCVSETEPNVPYVYRLTSDDKIVVANKEGKTVAELQASVVSTKRNPNGHTALFTAKSGTGQEIEIFSFDASGSIFLRHDEVTDGVVLKCDPNAIPN